MVLVRRTVRRGKTGPFLVDERKVHDLSEEQMDQFDEIKGDEKAKVKRGFLFGVSEEIRPGLWMKAEVYAEATLQCDQSEIGVEEGNELACDVAKKWALDELEEAHQFLRDFKGD